MLALTGCSEETETYTNPDTRTLEDILTLQASYVPGLTGMDFDTINSLSDEEVIAFIYTAYGVENPTDFFTMDELRFSLVSLSVYQAHVQERANRNQEN